MCKVGASVDKIAITLALDVLKNLVFSQEKYP